MQYFVLPIFLIIISELFGSVILNKLKVGNFTFNGIVGFVFILALTYVIYFPLVLLNVNFVTLLITTILLFLIIVIFIIKNLKEIRIRATKKDTIIVLVLILIQIYFASLNKVGSLWRYDTVTYTNLITGSIYGTNINSIDFSNGFYYGFYPGYSFQSFYKLASCLYYLINVVCNVLHINFFYFTQHMWMYPIVLYTLFSEMIVNFIKELKIKKGYIRLLLFLFFILFMGNFYWNSEQAYLGNSFRMLFTSYSIHYLSKYFTTNKNTYLLLIFAINYANTACACSNSTLVLILMFMLWAVIKDNNHNFRWILLGTYLPLVNCLFQAMPYRIKLVYIVTIIFSILFICEKWFCHIVNKIRLKHIAVIAVGLVLILMSYKVTNNFLDFNSFIGNWSGWSDMTWDYTDFSELWRIIANIIYLILMICAVINNRNSKVTKILLLVALVFFNPFATAIQNEYMPVFYRNYDIVINYYTLFVGFKYLDELEFKNAFKYFFVVCSMLLFIYIGYKQLIYHPPGEGFDKDSGYNSLLKMENDEAETLLFLKEYLLSNNIKEGKAISFIYQFRTEFPNFKTLFNRGKTFNGRSCDLELYKVFFPADYYGDPYGPTDGDYENVCLLLKESDYDLLVLSKNKLFYDEEQNIYYSLTYLVDEEYIPIYENNTYSVYWLRQEV